MNNYEKFDVFDLKKIKYDTLRTKTELTKKYKDYDSSNLDEELTLIENTIIEKNKKLCEEFPFLIPTNRWTTKVPEDYDYTSTEIDDMPYGWFKAFGMNMLRELKEALGNSLNKYRITQIKEKYGGLRWYDAGCTEEGFKVIHKYSRLSQITCIKCGKPATKISGGWISPYCDECYEKIIGDIEPAYYIVDGKIFSNYDEDE